MLNSFEPDIRMALTDNLKIDDEFESLNDEFVAYDYWYEIVVFPHMSKFRWIATIHRSYWEQWPYKIGYGVSDTLENSYILALDSVCADIDKVKTF